MNALRCHNRYSKEPLGKIRALSHQLVNVMDEAAGGPNHDPADSWAHCFWRTTEFLPEGPSGITKMHDIDINLFFYTKNSLCKSTCIVSATDARNAGQ